MRIAKISELTGAQTVAGPFHYDAIMKIPGVYRTTDDKTPSSLAVIIVRGGGVLFVRDNIAEDLSTSNDPEFWLTIVSVPDIITAN